MRKRQNQEGECTTRLRDIAPRNCPSENRATSDGRCPTRKLVEHRSLLAMVDTGSCAPGIQPARRASRSSATHWVQLQRLKQHADGRATSASTSTACRTPPRGANSNVSVNDCIAKRTAHGWRSRGFVQLRNVIALGRPSVESARPVGMRAMVSAARRATGIGHSRNDAVVESGCSTIDTG